MLIYSVSLLWNLSVNVLKPIENMYKSYGCEGFRETDKPVNSGTNQIWPWLTFLKIAQTLEADRLLKIFIKMSVNTFINNWVTDCHKKIHFRHKSGVFGCGSASPRFLRSKA